MGRKENQEKGVVVPLCLPSPKSFKGDRKKTRAQRTGRKGCKGKAKCVVVSLLFFFTLPSLFSQQGVLQTRQEI